MHLIATIILTIIIIYIWSWFAVLYNYIKYGFKSGDWSLLLKHIFPKWLLWWIFLTIILYYMFK